MKPQAKYNIKAAKPMALNDTQALPPPSSSPAMVRTQIYLNRAEYDFVQAQATQRGEPMAAVIRSFIEEKMKLPTDVWTNNPMLRPTPVDPHWNSPEDAAINHDHYLSGCPKKWIKVRGQWVEAPPLPDDYYENEASYAAYHQKVREMESPA